MVLREDYNTKSLVGIKAVHAIFSRAASFADCLFFYQTEDAIKRNDLYFIDGKYTEEYLKFAITDRQYKVLELMGANMDVTNYRIKQNIDMQLGIKFARSSLAFPLTDGTKIVKEVLLVDAIFDWISTYRKYYTFDRSLDSFKGMFDSNDIKFTPLLLITIYFFKISSHIVIISS